jgi:hypothetical protein
LSLAAFNEVKRRTDPDLSGELTEGNLLQILHIIRLVVIKNEEYSPEELVCYPVQGIGNNRTNNPVGE